MNLLEFCRKTNKIYPYGMYIIDNTYAIADKKSREKLDSLCLITFTPDVIQELKSEFKDKKIVYISTQKLDETVIRNGIKPVTDYEEKQLRSMLKDKLNYINDKSKWNQFSLSDDVLDRIFNEGDIISHKFDDNDATLIIGKKSFPSVKRDNINDMMYKLYTFDSVFNIKCCVFRYSNKFMQLDFIYLFL